MFKIKHVYDRSTSAKNRFFSKIYIPGDSDGTPLCSRILLHRSISSDASNNLDENDADNYEPWEFNLKEHFMKSLMLDYIFDDSITTYKLSHHDAGFALKKNNLIGTLCTQQ